MATCRSPKETLLEARDSTRRFWRISTAGIFFQGGAAIVELLTSLAGKQTVIIATHDERIAGAADRVIHLADGQITAEEAGRAKGDAEERQPVGR